MNIENEAIRRINKEYKKTKDMLKERGIDKVTIKADKFIDNFTKKGVEKGIEVSLEEVEKVFSIYEDLDNPHIQSFMEDIRSVLNGR